jgi:hypothetical protein
MDIKKGVSYSRPEDPRGVSYAVHSSYAEEILARACQVHMCMTEACLKLVKNQLVCKWHTPFALSETDWIAPDGSWGSRR